MTEADADKVFDATEFADLSLTFTPIEEGEEAGEEAGSSTRTSGSTRRDSPTVATAFADFLGELDPGWRRRRTRRTRVRSQRAGTLDAEFEAGLAACESTDLVTSHNAFGYLADRYGLEQVGITGLTPDDEPSPADLAAVTDFVARQPRAHDLLRDARQPRHRRSRRAGDRRAHRGARSRSKVSTTRPQGEDYLEIMRANLANLRTGQPCP